MQSRCCAWSKIKFPVIVNKDMIYKDKDKAKDQSGKDKDKDKDLAGKDKDKDKDKIFVLKYKDQGQGQQHCLYSRKATQYIRHLP
jgi:hypothetical protein